MFILLGHALDSEFQVPLNSPPSCLAPFPLDMLMFIRHLISQSIAITMPSLDIGKKNSLLLKVLSFYIIGLGQASSLLSCCLAASSAGQKRYPEVERSKQEGKKAPELNLKLWKIGKRKRTMEGGK